MTPFRLSQKSCTGKETAILQIHAELMKINGPILGGGSSRKERWEFVIFFFKLRWKNG